MVYALEACCLRFPFIEMRAPKNIICIHITHILTHASIVAQATTKRGNKKSLLCNKYFLVRSLYCIHTYSNMELCCSIVANCNFMTENYSRKNTNNFVPWISQANLKCVHFNFNIFITNDICTQPFFFLSHSFSHFIHFYGGIS